MNETDTSKVDDSDDSEYRSLGSFTPRDDDKRTVVMVVGETREELIERRLAAAEKSLAEVDSALGFKGEVNSVMRRMKIIANNTRLAQLETGMVATSLCMIVTDEVPV